MGGRWYVNGATFSADRAAFFDNTATVGAQAVQVVGASTVRLTAMWQLVMIRWGPATAHLPQQIRRS